MLSDYTLVDLEEKENFLIPTQKRWWQVARPVASPSSALKAGHPRISQRELCGFGRRGVPTQTKHNSGRANGAISQPGPRTWPVNGGNLSHLTNA